MVGAEFHLVLVAAFEREQRHAAGGRIFQLFAEFDFLFVKAGEIVAARVLDGRMKRRERLHEHLALDVAAPGAAGDLREQLEGALARAEIRLMQRKIGVNDADERDVREMQPFGNHLRADEDVGLARAKIAEHFSVIILALHRVGVHAPDARVREKFHEGFLDFLRAHTGVADGRVFAFRIRARGGHGVHESANVAAELLFRAMIREREAAIRALRDVTAFRALQRRRIAAPVQKQNRLLAAFEPLRDGFLELR